MKKYLVIISVIASTVCCAPKAQKLTDMVNPFLGTATLWDSAELGFTPTRRTWGAEVFPGSSLPNAMVQATPITMFRSGSGYQYEDSLILGFAHTSKGHWNLGYIPILPVTGEEFTAEDYASGFTHEKESARPAYYQVYLDRYGVNAELTSTLRCAFHKYTFDKDAKIALLANLPRANEHVRDWAISQNGENVFSGFQSAWEKMYFYATSNYAIESIDTLKSESAKMPVVHFKSDNGQPLELKIGFSFVSVENAKANLEAEMLAKSFEQVQTEGDKTWEALLSKIKVSGATQHDRNTFYSCLYRSFLWPVLRSDVNGEFTDAKGVIQNKGFSYYSDPSFWDDYRNKLILLGMISPEVAQDVISSCIDRGENSGGFMPTFFHGDHASTFVSGSYLRGLKDFDVQSAYKLILNNAMVEGPSRPFLNEYITKGYISEITHDDPKIETEAKASVTKTQEYAYDDYAVALMAKELGDTASYNTLMGRVHNYRNLFDPSTGLMRGKTEDGKWIKNFDPYFPYYMYMYREANGWQSAFFAPHDTEGMIAQYPSKEAFEIKLDSVFTTPWKGYEAHNMSGFIGQYCHGNQPDHSYPYLYYFVDKQEKGQAIIDSCLHHFYDMGKDGLAYSGMDDAGEMSAWYIFNAIGMYTYSPADPEYIVTVPLFDRVEFTLGDKVFTIVKQNAGKKISEIKYGGEVVDGYFINHNKLKEGKELTIITE